SDRRRRRFPELPIFQHAKTEPASKPRKSLSTSISAAMIPQNRPLDSLKTLNIIEFYLKVLLMASSRWIVPDGTGFPLLGRTVAGTALGATSDCRNFLAYSHHPRNQ